MDLVLPDVLDLVFRFTSDVFFESKDKLLLGFSMFLGRSSACGITLLMVTISAWVPLESDTGLKVTFETLSVGLSLDGELIIY